MESPRRDLSSASSASSVSVDSVSSRGTSPGLHRQLAGSECDSMGQNGNPGQDFSRLHLELGQPHALHEHSAPSDSSGQKDAQPIQALPTFAPLQPFNLSSAYHTPIIQSTTSTSSISGSSALSESSSSGDSEVSPPGNFAEVVPGLYRSSFPHEKHFPYLRSLGLKTIL